ncbi:MAG TPA: acyltransferase [Verrucomicrobiae bacterium]|jgi:peptidoglycan/LPS O-acetylase OafA/YrhL|nr:acyltransferase [Verrucomicrobiae bacterium]
MNRIASLDGLRAISISLVLVGHWAELRYHSDIAGAFANLGVRIFFIISGYLITTLLLTEYETRSTIRLGEFYARRAYRILPAAIVFMLPVFVIFRQDLRWYHMLAAAFYVANFDFYHPWFLGHLWSLSVEEQFYFLWPSILKKWHRHRIGILIGVIGFAPVYRILCHLIGLHGRADETFPAVADVLAIGCLLAVIEHAMKIPTSRAGGAREMGHPTTETPTSRAVSFVKSWAREMWHPTSIIQSRWALVMVLPIALVPVYMGQLRFHMTALLMFGLWPLMHVCIAGVLLHVVRRPYRFLNVAPMVWLGKVSYSLYLWQQLFVFGTHPRPWYYAFFALAMATASYHLVEQPMLRLRQRRSAKRAEAVLAQAA